MIYSDIIKKVFSDYFAFLRSGDYNYMGIIIAYLVIFLFIDIIIYLIYKN